MTATDDAKAARLLRAIEKTTKIRESAEQAQLSAIKSAAAAGVPPRVPTCLGSTSTG